MESMRPTSVAITYYRLPTKFPEGNVFSCVCLSLLSMGVREHVTTMETPIHPNTLGPSFPYQFKPVHYCH